jgi:hypothetical protein
MRVNLDFSHYYYYYYIAAAATTTTFRRLLDRYSRSYCFKFIYMVYLITP